MKSFTSKNLIMRPLAAQDIDMFCALYTDEKTMRFIEPAYSHKAAINSFNTLVKKNSNSNAYFNTWAIIRNNNDIKTEDTQNSIGLVMLYGKAGKQRLKVTEIGIMLLHQVRGKNVAEEALGSTLSYGFSQLNLLHINIRFDKRNLAIKHLSKKTGFNSNQSFADEVLKKHATTIRPIKHILDHFNNNNTRLETISRAQWQQNKRTFPIQVQQQCLDLTNEISNN